MPRDPIQTHFAGDALPLQADAAARRRLRTLENTFPAVREWEVATRSRPVAGVAGHRAEAHVAATIVGGHRFEADAFGTDVLAALRLAFNAIETQLREDSGHEHHPALHWFGKVRSRTARNWFSAD